MMLDIRQLPDQIVRPIPKTLSDLRRAIANLELKDATDTLLENMEKAGFKKPPAYPTPPPPTIMNPVSLFYEKVVKKIQERSKKKKRMEDAPFLE